MFDLLLTDYTLRTVCLGTTGIGAVSGALGCFAYLRRQSLIGDVGSHSTLLGIVFFFLCSYWLFGEGSKSLLTIIPGAIVAGTLALLLTRMITSETRTKEDTGLGVMLAIFFGAGVFLLRWVQRQQPAIPGRAGLDEYLFGMAAAMGRDDLIMIAILGAISIALMILMWKEFKVYTFDPVFAQSLGMRTKWLDTLLLITLVIGIVIGIQAVGVVLMIALLITPASAARQWTRSLGTMVILSSVFGGVCGFTGSLISSTFSHIPTGPVIVLVASTIFVLSVVFAPRRGLLAKFFNRNSNRLEAEIRAEAIR